MKQEEIKIAICDDSPEAIEELQGKIEQYFKRHEINAEIVTFLNGEALIQEVSKLDVIFLDIEMPGMDGLEVGSIICRYNERCKIIMATAMEGKMQDSFKVNAFRFLVKPYIDAEIKEALDAVRASAIGNQTVELYEKRNLFVIAQREAAYFQAYNSYVEAVVHGRKMRKDVSLSQLEALLDERLFCRASRRYIVNLRFVNSCKDGTMFIKGLNSKIEKIKLSRAKKKEFEKRYMEYDLRYR